MRLRYALIAAMIALGYAVPYHPLLRIWPWGGDAQVWISKGMWGYPGHWPWILSESHFIGYRPVTALSFLLNHTFGLAPWIYRGTDLALAAVAVWLAAMLGRLLFGEEDRRLGLGHLAALLFALHPVQDEILCDVARRSYSLSMVLGLSGVMMLVTGARAGQPLTARLALGSVLLTLGLLSNEIALLLVPILVLLVANEALQRGEWRAAWRPLALPLGMIALAWLRRSRVVRIAGGYVQDMVAVAVNGDKNLTMPQNASRLSMAERAVDYVTFPVSFRGTRGIGLAGEVGAELLMLVAVLLTLALAWRRRHEADGRLGAILVLWALGGVLMCFIADVWFWRMAYPIVLPYALMLVWLLREVWRTWPTVAPRAAGLTLVTLLAVPVAAHSSMLRGLDTQPLIPDIRGSAIIRGIRPAIQEAVDGRGQVFLALPVTKGKADTIRMWLNRLFPRNDIDIGVLSSDLGGERLGRLKQVGDDKYYVFGPDAEPDARWKRVSTPDGFPIRMLATADKPATFIFPDPEGGWSIEQIPRRPKSGLQEAELERPPPQGAPEE